MATEQLWAGSKWRFNPRAPGTHILFTSNYSVGDAFMDGYFWNDHEAAAGDSTPERFPLKDISGRPTTIGIRTIDAFSSNGLGNNTPPDVAGYPADAWDNPYYANTAVSTIEFYGIPADSIVDLAVAGSRLAADARGHNVISEGKLAAQVISGNSGRTGPIIFRGIEPEYGAIQVGFIAIDNFVYTQIFDLRVYRR